MAVIFYGSTNVLSAQRTSRFLVPFLRWAFPGISEPAVHQVQLVTRKCGHLAEYAILGMLLWRARRKPVPGDVRPWRWAEVRWAVGMAACYALTDELHQGLVASRQGSPWDILIDAVGATAGLLALWAIGRWRQRW